jgi:hypothetical protein
MTQTFIDELNSKFSDYKADGVRIMLNGIFNQQVIDLFFNLFNHAEYFEVVQPLA